MTDASPYYQDDNVTIYCGDALKILPHLDTGSVDAVITDPPYSSGGQFRGDRAQDTHTKYRQGTAPKNLISFTGDNKDQRSHLIWTNLWASEALRVLRPGAIFGVFTDWRQLPLTTDALQISGAIWRGVLPWYKPNSRMTLGRYANQCEYFVWGTNGARPLTHEVPTLKGFWEENTPHASIRQHQTQKPVGLMRFLTSLTPTGGVVLDPFSGSGSTLVGAIENGVRAIGIELDPVNCEISVSRCKEAQANKDSWLAGLKHTNDTEAVMIPGIAPMTPPTTEHTKEG